MLPLFIAMATLGKGGLQDQGPPGNCPGFAATKMGLKSYPNEFDA